MAVPTKDKATPKAPSAEKKGPDFGLVLLTDLEELPEEPKRSRSVGYAEIKENLIALQATPNVWAEVAHYAAKPGSDENPTGAKKTVLKFLSGDVKPPLGGEDGGEYDIEWRSASYDGSDRVGSVVLAKYVVEASA